MFEDYLKYEFFLLCKKKKIYFEIKRRMKVELQILRRRRGNFCEQLNFVIKKFNKPTFVNQSELWVWKPGNVEYLKHHFELKMKYLQKFKFLND